MVRVRHTNGFGRPSLPRGDLCLSINVSRSEVRFFRFNVGLIQDRVLRHQLGFVLAACLLDPRFFVQQVDEAPLVAVMSCFIVTSSSPIRQNFSGGAIPFL